MGQSSLAIHDGDAKQFESVTTPLDLRGVHYVCVHNFAKHLITSYYLHKLMMALCLIMTSWLYVTYQYSTTYYRVISIKVELLKLTLYSEVIIAFEAQAANS